jgi:hypothetical protein
MYHSWETPSSVEASRTPFAFAAVGNSTTISILSGGYFSKVTPVISPRQLSLD